MNDVLAMRKKLKLNQAQFWTRLGVTQSGGSRYESGRSIPKPTQTLMTLAYGSEHRARRTLNKLRAAA